MRREGAARREAIHEEEMTVGPMTVKTAMTGAAERTMAVATMPEVMMAKAAIAKTLMTEIATRKAVMQEIVMADAKMVEAAGSPMVTNPMINS